MVCGGDDRSSSMLSTAAQLAAQSDAREAVVVLLLSLAVGLRCEDDVDELRNTSTL